MKPINFNDLDQSCRYNTKVASRLVLALPITDFRPEAMRVTERNADGDIWFEVETYNEALGRWVSQKDHALEADATRDATNWYLPANEAAPTSPG